ncbi:MAG: hypothetical protein NC203_01385 [Firmicutes bacterium]|nr:hypothetical protein [[Eubacterium] siraeum]MCM1486994.1 hypothetical protein [Bacillota bacterium]
MSKNSRTKAMRAAKEAQEARSPRDEREEKSGKVLDSLEGSVVDVEEETAEETEAEESFDSSAPTVKNSKLMFVIGLLVIVMTVVGLFTTVRSAIELGDRLIHQTALKEDFAEFLYPVVITDTPAFASVEEAPPSIIINAAIWRIILSGNTDKYENDGSTMIVSEIDVESAAAALFGFGVPIEHQSVGFGESMFTYNSSTKSYTVPLNLAPSNYWPRVSEMSNVGELFTVTVEYMSPIMAVGGIDLDSETANKTMIYTVSRTASSMTVISVAYDENSTLQE